MPKYIFSLAGDHDGWGGEAKDLPDPQAAKCIAIRMISETLCNHPQTFWEKDTHTVTVSDENMLTQFIVEMAEAADAVRRVGSLDLIVARSPSR